MASDMDHYSAIVTVRQSIYREPKTIYNSDVDDKRDRVVDVANIVISAKTLDELKEKITAHVGII